jgi:hypothetical protein
MDKNHYADDEDDGDGDEVDVETENRHVFRLHFAFWLP